MPSTKRDVAPISGEEAGRQVLLDLSRQLHNKKHDLPEGEGRLSPQALSDMLYGLQTQADVKVYNEYRQLHSFLAQMPMLLLALSRGAMLAVAQNHEELLMARLYKNYEPNEPLIRANITLFIESAKAFAAYNVLIKVTAHALEIPELMELMEELHVEHVGSCNELAAALYPDDPPLFPEQMAPPSRALEARALTALRSPKLPLVRRVEKALARLNGHE